MAKQMSESGGILPADRVTSAVTISTSKVIVKVSERGRPNDDNDAHLIFYPYPYFRTLRLSCGTHQRATKNVTERNFSRDAHCRQMERNERRVRWWQQNHRPTIPPCPHPELLLTTARRLLLP
eukprot:scaffold34685_cov183-Amphora_coffeaeformis.AAC.19